MSASDGESVNGSEDESNRLAEFMVMIKESTNEERAQALMDLCESLSAGENRSLLKCDEGGLLSYLVELVKDKEQERLRAIALLVLVEFAGVEENQKFMASSDLVLLPVLVEIVRQDKNSLSCGPALGVLWNLACLYENKVSMAASADLGLLPLLMEVVKEDKEQARVQGLGALQALAGASENQLLMASEDFGLLPVLVEVLREDDGEARENALLTIKHLASNEQNVIPLVRSTELNLLPVLVQVVKEDEGESRVHALATLSYLAGVEENRVAMVASAELGLLSVLMTVVRYRTGQARVKALETIFYLSLSEKNKLLIATSPELGLLPELVGVMREDTGEGRVWALEVLAVLTLALPEEHKVRMASADLGLLSVLVEVVKEDKRTARLNAIILLWDLQKTAKGAVDAACKELDLCAMVLELMREGDFDLKITAAQTLSNVPTSIDLAQRQALAQEVTTMLEGMLFADNRSKAEMIQVMSAVWFITQHFGATCVSYMTQSKLPQIAADKLREAGPIVSAWQSNDLCLSMLNYAMNLARYEAAVGAMKSAGYVEIASALLAHPDNGCERLKAMYIVSFLTGKDEQSQQKVSVAQQYPDIIAQLVSMLENTLNRVIVNDYPPWTFSLGLTINACQVLSISDGNKEPLLKTALLPLLLRALKMFVDNEPPILLCGGGGKDVETAELAVATITQLSFFYDADSALQSAYLMQPGFIALLKGFIGNKLPSAAAKENAQLLLKRLTATAAAVPNAVSAPVSTNAASTPKHIMLSYCWHASAQPDLVKKLYAGLTARGYDVWRDEVGSSLVPPMAGSTDERMAEALEAAGAVVICVSRMYKEGPNCRMEAKYANQLYKKGKLQVYYVMMQGDYTTVSEPDCCDGWLGIMLGDALWYPLWDAGMVEGAVGNLATQIGGKCKLQQDVRPASPVTPTMPEKLRSAVAEAAPQDDNCTQAWEILNNPMKVQKPADVRAYLDDLGVLEAGDLLACEKDALQALAAMLKPTQKKKFEKLMLEG